MNHIGNKLRQVIESQYNTINNFSELIDFERQLIYQDTKREDLNTKRLRAYLPALGLTFSEFFKDFEESVNVFETQRTKGVNISNNEINTQKAYYETLLSEKERTIETQKELIELLKANKNQ